LRRFPAITLVLIALQSAVSASVNAAGARPGPGEKTTLISRFQSGMEGWQVWNKGVQAYHNPEGHLTVVDDGEAPAYWSAPERFLGDQSAVLGGVVLARVRDDLTHGASMRAPGFVIQGAGLELVHRARPARDPRGRWWTMRATVNARSGWRHAATGEMATPAELGAAFGAVERLLVRCRVHRDAREADLREVVLGYRTADVGILAPAPKPKLKVTPKKLKFGKVYLGDFARRTVTVKNTDSVSVQMRTPDLVPPYALVSHPEDQLLDLGPGASLELTLEFRPDEVKIESDFVLVDFPLIDVMLRVSLEGEGRHPLEFTPKSLNYGKVKLGDSKSLKATFRNRAAKELTLAIQLPEGGPWTTNFELIAIAPGGVAPVDIVFKPTTTAKLNLSIDIVSTVELGGDNLPLLKLGLKGQGKGLAPLVEVDPGVLDFGEIGYGLVATLPLTVKNLGNAPLQIAMPDDLTEPFRWAPGSPDVTNAITIAPLDEVQFQVEYAPQEEANHQQVIQFASNDLENLFVFVPLRGKGVQHGEASIEFDDEDPTNVQMDPTYPGTRSLYQLTFTNTGTRDVEYWVTPAGAPFEATPQEGQEGPVEPGTAGTVFIDFAPADLGTYTTSVTFHTDIPGWAPLTISITATCIEDPFLNSTSKPRVGVKQSSPRKVTAKSPAAQRRRKRPAISRPRKTATR